MVMECTCALLQKLKNLLSQLNLCMFHESIQLVCSFFLKTEIFAISVIRNLIYVNTLEMGFFCEISDQLCRI